MTTDTQVLTDEYRDFRLDHRHFFNLPRGELPYPEERDDLSTERIEATNLGFRRFAAARPPAAPTRLRVRCFDAWTRWLRRCMGGFDNTPDPGLRAWRAACVSGPPLSATRPPLMASVPAVAY